MFPQKILRIVWNANVKSLQLFFNSDKLCNSFFKFAALFQVFNLLFIEFFNIKIALLEDFLFILQTYVHMYLQSYTQCENSMTNAFEQGRTKMFPRHIFTTNDVLKRFLGESMQAHFYYFRKNIYVEVYISDRSGTWVSGYGNCCREMGLRP